MDTLILLATRGDFKYWDRIKATTDDEQLLVATAYLRHLLV